MNPDFPKDPREELEVRLTALLLGELQAEEADALRRTIERDTALSELYDRLKYAIGLVEEATASEPEQTVVQSPQLKLGEERRQKLLAHLKTVAPKEFAKPPRPDWSWVAPLGAAAAIVLLAAIALPNFTRARTTAKSNAIINNLRQIDSAKQQWALETHKSANDIPTLSDITPYLGRGNDQLPAAVAGETYSLGPVGESPTAELKRGKRVQQYVLSDEAQPGSKKMEVADSMFAGHSPDELAVGKPTEAAPVNVPPPAQLAPPPIQSTAKQTEVVLPGSGEANADQLETRVFHVNPDTFTQGRQSTGTFPLESLVQNTTGGGVGGGVFGGAPNGGGTTSVSQGIVAGDAATGVPGPVTFSASTDLNDQKHTAAGFGELAHSPTNRFITRYAYAAPAPSERLVGTDVVAPAQPNFSIDAKSADARQKEEKALAFDWYNKNLIKDKSGSGVQGGTSPLAPSLRGFYESNADQSAALPSVATMNGREAGVRTPEKGVTGIPPAVTTIPRGTTTENSIPLVEHAWIGMLEEQNTQTRDLVRMHDDLEKRVAEREAALLSGLEAKQKATKTHLAELDKAAEATKMTEKEMIAQNRPYFEAKRQLDEAQKVRDAVQLRILQESVDAAIPKSSVVEITDVAEAESAKSPTLGQRLAKQVTGKVERTARVAVERDVSDITPLGFPHNGTAYDPNFIQTEFEKIRSKAVLDKVIDKLDLNGAWAKKYGDGGKLTTERTFELLSKSVNVRREANSSLIDIDVKNEDPAEAARIANTIAEVYRDERAKLRQQVALAGIEQLKENLDQQNKKVASAREALDRLKPESAVRQGDEDRPIRRPAPNAPVPQPEVLTRENAFSTFSLNVSDVSFKLASASLEKGQMPDPASVRSEEFINAFDYRDPEPPAGVPIAFTWERARYPFAQNRDLLRFSIKTAAAGRQPGRPLNLVLLLDNSGSMERADRVQIIHEAMRVLADQLRAQDRISVVTFARTARLWADGLSGDQAGDVLEQAGSITPQGGTNLEEALRLAYETALRHYLATGMNRVVLLTDGAANLGNVDPEALGQKVENYRKQGIALDCFGIGWEGYNDDLLGVLSSNGDGRYGFLNSPGEAATRFASQLAGAFKVAASDVKVQVEFNPGRVTAYRQIGYAKHQLSKEQFRDNTVDAAEIGAAEAGNALYTVEVNPQGEGPLATVRVRYKVPGTSDYREQAWNVPFTGSAVALDQSSPAMRLAATAGAFSEWLVASPFAAEVTPDALLSHLSGVPAVYGADERPKKLEWMMRQAKSIGGK